MFKFVLCLNFPHKNKKARPTPLTPENKQPPTKPIKRYTINVQNDQTYKECQITSVGDDKGNDSTASESANGYKTSTSCWRHLLDLNMSTDCCCYCC